MGLNYPVVNLSKDGTRKKQVVSPRQSCRQQKIATLQHIQLRLHDLITVGYRLGPVVDIVDHISL